MTNETRNDSDRRLANMRLAAAINLVLLSMAHAGRTVFTDRDAQTLRLATGLADDCMTHGVGGTVPSGFGIAETSQSVALEAVLKSLEDVAETVPSSQRGSNDNERSPEEIPSKTA